jgi:hypothetical protein
MIQYPVLLNLQINATVPLRCVSFGAISACVAREEATLGWEPIMVNFRAAIIGATSALALAAAPITPASAHWHNHGGVVFGLAALGTAAVVGAATILTAPVRALAAPVYAPPAPAYYAPYAPPPVYYAPPPAYSYAPPPPAAYYPPPGYYGR